MKTFIVKNIVQPKKLNNYLLDLSKIYYNILIQFYGFSNSLFLLWIKLTRTIKKKDVKIII